jgi:hypothetical protein
MDIKFFEFAFFDLVLDQKNGGSKSQDIHQAVPADLQGTDGEDDRVYVGI